MKAETEKLFNRAVEVGESIARSQGRTAIAYERLATAAEAVAGKLTELAELAAQQSLTIEEVTGELGGLDIAPKNNEPEKGKATKGKASKPEKGAKNA